MNLFDKKRKEKGYTLAEVLTTVMILIILMAIAVPAIFSIRKNLRQKALDSKAELIYTAVQNNLTKLRNNGNSSLYASSGKATKMQTMPSDATEKKNLYYATAAEKENTNKAASVLVTTDTVDEELYSHYWVVEYNPESASVYAVFYSETRNNDYTTESYNSLRYKEERLADGARVGYYGGDAVDGSNTSTLAPKVTITNEEKLIASISCLRPDSKPLSFEITLQDDADNKVTLKYQAFANGTQLGHSADDLHIGTESKLDKNENGSIVGVLYTLNITLDDLTFGADGAQPGRFTRLYGKDSKSTNKLNAGTPLTITVKVKSESSKIDGLSTTVKTNSLFADNSTKTKAVLTYGRHLQNLDEASGVTANITEAEQQSDIHFEKQDDKEGTQSWYDTYTVDNKEMTFTPITNNSLQKLTGQYQGTSGMVNTTIYHLTVKNQVKAGLFATLPKLTDGVLVDSIHLSGMKISSDNMASNSVAGGIAGETTGKTTLTNCQVYLEKTDVEGKGADDAWISGAKKMGGLIGNTSSEGSVTIDKCLAATVMGDENAQYVGGLIGYNTRTISISDSYSDSYLTGDYTGGLIAYNESGGTISSCYTAGYQTARTSAGGFVGEVRAETDNLVIQNGYTAVTWLTWNFDGTEAATKRYAVAGYPVKENVYYLNSGNQEGDKTEFGTKVGYKQLSKRDTMVTKLNSSSFVSSAKSTTPYNLKNQGLSSYSYPSINGLPHYGDWEATFEPGSLVYYEVYAEEDGTTSYGFFGANLSPTLSDSKTVIGDGYGIVYLSGEEPAATESITVTYQNGPDAENDKDTLVINGDDTTYSVTNGSEKYVIYPLPSKVVNEAAIKDTYYQKLVIKGAAAVGNKTTGTDSTGGTGTDEDTSDVGSTFYYNPHFAKTVVNANQAPETIDDISIRTARQLYQLSLYYPDYKNVLQNCKFVQELDIDYGTYGPNDEGWNQFAGTDGKISVQQPIGAKNGSLTSFVATYEGKYHEIRGISFQTKQTAVGFIGENAGRVQNVFLVSDYQNAAENGLSNPFIDYTGKIQNNRTVYMGVMAGINKGTIRNCAVCGYDMDDALLVYVQRNGTLYMGGFVGSNQGTITGCQSDSPSMKVNALYGTAYLGGFAGENSSIIQNSYAVGNAMVTYAKSSKSVIGGFTARNSGSLRNDYCAVAMTGAGSTDTYGFSPKGGKVASTCYYLNGGTFEYLKDMYAFDNNNGSGKSTTYNDMVEKAGDISGTISKYYSGTVDSEVSNAGYPFAPVVQRADGSMVHYGNWQLPVDLGGIGVLYWEYEDGGANPGYHFSYIGYVPSEENSTSAMERRSGSTLCEEHDDGGIVTQYGYGYYYSDTNPAISAPVPHDSSAFQTGDISEVVSYALSQRLDGFTVVAYTTAPAIGGNSFDATRKYMTMTAKNRQANVEWTLEYNSMDYVFTISPFFANAMQYGGENTSAISVQSIEVLDNGVEVQSDENLPMPGTAGNEYEIRSADQLQYMNWNYNKANAVTVLDKTNYTEDVAAYTYLGYMSGNATKEQPYYRWTGTESPTRTQEEFSDYNENCKAFRTYKTNTSYWEFVKDDNCDTEYSVISTWNWQQHYLSPWDSHYHYSVQKQTLRGYWKWVGDTDTLLNTQDSSLYRKVEVDTKYSWIQSHDVDANMSHDGDRLFTQIGSLFDAMGDRDVEAAEAYMTYFNGSYDGNSYSIKNVEIRNSGTSIGLFGSIIGAKVQNIILYSDKGNYIQRLSGTKSWYTIGGLCGLAAIGQGNTAEQTSITNCTVSGYTIQDNSTQSTWGDGNVGGMIGMCTINLKNCSAVNNVVVNTEFIYEKNDGVSVRAGGLVGSMRGNITNCYTGGEISATEKCLANAKEKSPDGHSRTKLFIGGITGGIYIKNGGNLTELLGTIQGLTGWQNKKGYRCEGVGCSVPTTIIKNSYTYMKLPNTDIQANKVIQSVNPIGSNGETPHERNYNCHVLVRMINCYYYKNNISTIKSFTTGNAGAGGSKTNIDNSQAYPIEWEELAGQKDITIKIGIGTSGTTKTGNILDLLNVKDGGGTFGTVTVMENDQKVDGKYSFPGNRTDLDGENYPFPTILTQKTTSGQTVNVHYGGWTLEGIYWKESRASMDIFENMEINEGDTAETAKSRKTFELEDEGGVLPKNLTLDSGFTVAYSRGDDSDTATASLSGENDENVQAVFSGEMAADEDEEFSDGSNGDSTVTDEFTGASDEIASFAADSTADTGSDSGVTTLSEDDLIAKVVDIKYDTDKKKYIATVEALKTGTTVITVEATVGNGTTRQTYTASFSLTVTADLTVVSDPDSITQLVHDSIDVTLYAVPTALMTSTNSLDSTTGVVGAAEATEGFQDQETGDDGWSSEDETSAVFAGENAFEAESEFESDSNYVDMITDQSDGISVFAADYSALKNLASFMTWKVEADQVGPVSITMGANNTFTVTSESTDFVTLTVTGTYVYNEISYTFTTWIEVSATEGKGISWDAARTTPEIYVGNTYTVVLNDPDKWFAENGLTKEDITITEATDTQNVSSGEPANAGEIEIDIPENEENAFGAADAFSAEQAYVGAATDETGDIVQVTAITPNSDKTGYEVTIRGLRAGTATITVNAKDSEGTIRYTDSFNLKVKTDPFDTDSSADTDSGWDTSTGDYVDIIPDENNDFSDEAEGWGTGE